MDKDKLLTRFQAAERAFTDALDELPTGSDKVWAQRTHKMTVDWAARALCFVREMED